MVPILYDSKESIQESRHRLEASLLQLHREVAEGNLSLPRLDQLAMPGTFYIVYQVGTYRHTHMVKGGYLRPLYTHILVVGVQGYNDTPVMEAIHSLYAQLYPRLIQTDLLPLPPSTDPSTYRSRGRRGGGVFLEDQ